MVHYYLINTLNIYDITEILLKVALNHINLTIKYLIVLFGPHIIKWRKINMKSLLHCVSKYLDKKIRNYRLLDVLFIRMKKFFFFLSSQIALQI
jgi:hypothetical protein